MTPYWLLVWAVLAGFSTANLVKKESGQCEDYQRAVNVTFADLAGTPFYVKYMSTSDRELFQVIKNHFDSVVLELTRIGTSNNFTTTFNIIDNTRTPITRTSTLFKIIYDEATHSLIDNDKEEKFNIISFKPDKFALLYFCSQEIKFVLRMLLTTNLTLDVTQALEEDRKYNFTNSLVELPFRHLDLINLQPKL